MARWLRQSTSVDLPIGPFVDQTDGFTAETGLTLTQPDIRLKKNDAAWAQKNAAQTLSHEENGWYEVTLDSTDTNTLGMLMLAVNESGALPVWHEFLVVPANVWDSYFAADLLQVHAAEISAGLITATAIADNAIDAGAIADGAITAAKIATGAIDADAIATDAVTEIQAGLATSTALADVQTDTNDIQARLPAALVSGRMDSSVGAMAANTLTASALATDAVGEIADGVWDEDATGHQTQGTFGQAIGDPAADTDTIFALVNSISAAIAALDVPTAIENADALLDRTDGVESGTTMRQHLRLAAAALYGLSNVTSGQRMYRNEGNTKNRIAATVENGDRTLVVLDKS